MGRYGRIMILALLASVMLQGCVREDSLLQEGTTARRSATLRLTVCADRILDDATRISSGEDGRLQWDGDETIGIIFAKKASSTTNYRYLQELKSVPGRPGVFSGDIDPGKYKLSDIVGMVCPCNEDAWGKYHNSKGSRIVMQIGTRDLIQSRSGEPEWDEVPFFAEISSSDLVKDGSGYVIAGKTFRCGAALIGMTIYGRHADGSVGEKLQSVRINASTSVCCVGTSEWNISSDSFAFNGNTDKAYLAVRLSEPKAMGLQASSGATVYLPSMPRGETGGKVKFTHRMLLNMPDCRVGRAVTSNAGYYTFPVPDGIADAAGEVYSFPYSIKGMDMPVSQLTAFFARNLTVHVGTADIATTVEEDEDLPVSAGAKAQGACRYERGKNFYARSKAVADSLGLPFNWRLVEVPGVAHSASKMIKAEEVGTAALLYP